MEVERPAAAAAGAMSPEAAQMLKGFQNGRKQIPLTACLYDGKGSELYERITELEEYYPFLAEEEMLERCAAQVAQHIPPDSVVVELGCGTGRKTAILARAVVARHAKCKFAGIDVSGPFLEEAVKNLLRLVPGLREADVDMVQAEYLDGLRQVRKRYPTQLLIVVWLGSSVGNLTRDGAISFFQDVVESVGFHHKLFLCADMWKDVARLYSAYHDSQGVTELFIKNGMANALRTLRIPVSDDDEASWVYEVEVNKQLRRVEMFVRFPREISLPDQLKICPGERVLVEFSRKFTVDDLHDLATGAGYTITAAWRNEVYGGQMLVPAMEAFRECWEDTEEIFEKLRDWRVKPIDLRHPFCFYYGHVHAFAKLKVLPEIPQSPMDVMFSRGIDPHVADPSQCHSHPTIPPEWPEQAEIVNYGRQVRELIVQALEGGKISLRMINFALEHERMHQETLQYMVAQERKAEFEKKRRTASTHGQQNGFHHDHLTNGNGKSSQDHHHQNGGTNGRPGRTAACTVCMPPGPVTLGVDSSSGAFFWDNECPPHRTSVEAAFAVSSLPVSVSQFRDFVLQKGYAQQQLWRPDEFAVFHGKGVTCPASWSLVDGEEVWVHSPAASRHWTEVADEPVFVSLAEATAYCRWAGARIMTEAEYHRVLDVLDATAAMKVNSKKREERSDEIGGSHNVNGGAQLRNGYHANGGSKDVGNRVKMMRSGGWEWTSTVFQPFPGFAAMLEYPEYSADFFDGEHYVLKGSSPVTHPSLVRDSFRNFYQRMYPYVFAKFRCCYDL